MANKEATVYIVDVGKSMGRKQNGRSQTNLEWSMQYVWDKITTTVLDGKKTHTLGVVALRSDETQNEVAEQGAAGYENLSMLQDIKETLVPDLRSLREMIRPSSTNAGDIFSAIALAIAMIDRVCRHLKYKRRIVLVTDGTGMIADEDQSDQFVTKIKADNMELTVLGVDFNDPDFGFKEEEKDPHKWHNEKLLRQLCEDCDGAFGTLAEAISFLDLPRLTQPVPVAIFTGMLTLGDPSKYDTAMSIAIKRYPKIRAAKAPTASSFVVKSEGAAAGPSTQTPSTAQNGTQNGHGIGGGLAAVKFARGYVVDDDTAPGGKRELDRDDLARGYTYGRTAVPMEKSDEHVTKLNSVPSYDIVGFVAKEEYQHWMGMTTTNLVVGNELNQKACMAFSSLIHGLHETEAYAVGRLVVGSARSAPKDPVMVLMAPHFEPPDFECLVEVELPFAEDIRSFTFPSLDKVVAVSGKHITQHRNLPNEQLLSAMGDYVDAMDLSTFDKNDEGHPKEYAMIEETFNMRKNKIQRALQHRAVFPDGEPPAPSEVLSKFSKPPEELVQRAKPSLEAVVKAADVKKVPPKQKGRRRNRTVEKPLSGLDVDQLLKSNRPKRIKISAENAIPEFKQALESLEELSQMKEAMKQMGGVVEDLIKTSTGTLKYDRACEAMRVMKEEMTEYEEAGLYNQFLKGLKEKMELKELGGERRDMWYRIKVHKLGLIESDLPGGASAEEAREFLSFK